MNEPRLYGLIIEWKQEGPLIMEARPMTLAQAHEKMREICNAPQVIRAAMFSMAYETGNETLIPEGAEQ